MKKPPRRQLSIHFLEYMRDRGGWPPYDKMRALFVSAGQSGRYSHTSFSDITTMRRPSLVTLNEGLVAMMLHLVKKEPNLTYPKIFIDALADYGLAVGPHTQTAEVLDVLYDKTDSHTNLFMRGIEVIGEVAGIYDKVLDVVRDCQPDTDEPDQIANWICVAAARHLTSSKISIANAVEVAEAKMGNGCTVAKYAEHIRMWREAHPWTVVQTRGFAAAGGASIVLPITAEARALMIKGKLKSHTLEKEHLSCPSRILLIEANFPRPADMGGEPERAFKQLYLALLAQCAMLAKLTSKNQDQPLRIISFAGTPQTERQLIKFGFKPLNAKMLDTGAALLERELPNPGLDGYGLFLKMSIGILSGYISDDPRPLNPVGNRY